MPRRALVDDEVRLAVGGAKGKEGLTPLVPTRSDGSGSVTDPGFSSGLVDRLPGHVAGKLYRKAFPRTASGEWAKED